MAAGKVKAEKPALTLNFDKEAAEDLEYIARLIGQDTGNTVSLALGILKKIAEEKNKGYKTYIESSGGRKEEIILSTLSSTTTIPLEMMKLLSEKVKEISRASGKTEAEVMKIIRENALREIQGKR